jgi:phosphoglycolate phosphatase
VLAERPTSAILRILDRLGLDDNLFSIGERIRQMRGVSAPEKLRAVEGVTEVLRELDRNYKLAIVTTRRRATAEAFLSQEGLADLVQVITGREDTWRLKPHPSPIRHTAGKLDVSPERCIMVGDTATDIKAARAAGARSIGVLCGFGEKVDLELAGADRILSTTRELLDIL